MAQSGVLPTNANLKKKKRVKNTFKDAVRHFLGGGEKVCFFFFSLRKIAQDPRLK